MGRPFELHKGDSAAEEEAQLQQQKELARLRLQQRRRTVRWAEPRAQTALAPWETDPSYDEMPPLIWDDEDDAEDVLPQLVPAAWPTLHQPQPQPQQPADALQPQLLGEADWAEWKDWFPHGLLDGASQQPPPMPQQREQQQEQQQQHRVAMWAGIASPPAPAVSSRRRVVRRLSSAASHVVRLAGAPWPRGGGWQVLEPVLVPSAISALMLSDAVRGGGGRDS